MTPAQQPQQTGNIEDLGMAIMAILCIFALPFIALYVYGSVP